MGEGPSTRTSAPMDGTAIEPMLVLTFSGRGNGGTQRCRVPRVGLLLGRDAVVFDEPFHDSRMSPRHAEAASRGVGSSSAIWGARRGRASTVSYSPATASSRPATSFAWET